VRGAWVAESESGTGLVKREDGRARTKRPAESAALNARREAEEELTWLALDCS